MLDFATHVLDRGLLGFLALTLRKEAQKNCCPIKTSKKLKLDKSLLSVLNYKLNLLNNFWKVKVEENFINSMFYKTTWISCNILIQPGWLGWSDNINLLCASGSNPACGDYPCFRPLSSIAYQNIIGLIQIVYLHSYLLSYPEILTLTGIKKIKAILQNVFASFSAASIYCMLRNYKVHKRNNEGK